ncbi:MAG: hypothetical protein LC772_07390 [Chloroflexi bacterium]|nr:hypothetical protein [Chloroflexota bacterium]
MVKPSRRLDEAHRARPVRAAPSHYCLPDGCLILIVAASPQEFNALQRARKILRPLASGILHERRPGSTALVLWADRFPTGAPPIPDEALRRENLYDDRGL